MTTPKDGFWNRSHHLDRMTLRELVVAYIQYPAIIGYLLLSAVAMGLFAFSPAPLIQTLASVAAAVAVYPIAWYAIHRWVLHGQWMYKMPMMASTWKRIHFDHHQDPNHLEVLFGALHTTLPTIIIATMPVGWMIGGFGGAMAALAAGLLTTCVYEFVHCIQHLAFKPRSKLLARMKARHMAHHFHDETGNFGITNYFWDRAFGTFYERPERPSKSPTVFNLGYTPEVAREYPWVADMSDPITSANPRQRSRG